VSEVRLSVSGVSQMEICGVLHTFSGFMSSTASGNGPTANPFSSSSPETRHLVFRLGGLLPNFLILPRVPKTLIVTSL
jgi:hypothetical protein